MMRLKVLPPMDPYGSFAARVIPYQILGASCRRQDL